MGEMMKERFFYLGIFCNFRTLKLNSMKKIALFGFLAFATLGFSQEKCDDVKKENNVLKAKNQMLKKENDYFKKVFDINQPILQKEVDDTSFKVIKVVGNKAESRIYITLLLESKNENKKVSIGMIGFEGYNTSIIDLEGNEYKFDHMKSDSSFQKLTLDIPKKVIFVFKKVENQPLMIKLLRFQTSTQLDKDINTYKNNKTRANIEFRDLKVNWK